MSLRLRFDIKLQKAVPSCPHSRGTSGYVDDSHDEIYDGPDWCELADKCCLLESGSECEEYNQFILEELRFSILTIFLKGKECSYCCRGECEHNFEGSCYMRPEFTDAESYRPEIICCESYIKSTTGLMRNV